MTPRKALLIAFAALVLVLFEAVLIIAIFVSPTFRDDLGATVQRAAATWTAKDNAPGLPERARSLLSPLYRNWVEPLWKLRAAPTPDQEFASCLECHSDYAQQRRFGDLLLNHAEHASSGVACATCHTDTAHPEPLPPPEDACAECHDVKDPSLCDTCHTPGSVGHFFLLGYPRPATPDCDTCHLPGSIGGHHGGLVDAAAFDGSDPGACAACHEQATCDACHDVSHPEDWVATHGSSTVRADRGPCDSCHTIRWCADSCHAGRTIPLRELPAFPPKSETQGEP
ncbi:MAG: hypothetical protein GWP04_05185 [Gammaproteobacteria bacterium]|nr:hypothetical protein [Gammaproteobacteria bacterium]